MAITAEESKLISIFVQTLLYGAYTSIFAITCWVLIRRRPREQPINKTMLGIAITMFVFATMHIGVNYTRIIKAFVIFKDEPGGPGAFFNQLSEFTQLFGSTIYVAQTLVGDSVVLLRCYLVWGKRLSIVAFPILLLFGSTVTGGGILYSFAKVVPEAEIFVVELSQWIVAFFSMTLATNIICTVLVAYRIWIINRRTISFSEHSLRPIMLLVIESGAIYSATLTTLLILYKTQSWFQYVLLDAVSPIVGLVFSMVIVRIGLGITTANGHTEDFGQVSTLQASKFGSARTFDTRNVKSDRVELASFNAEPRTSDLRVRPVISTKQSNASSSNLEA
ncbi:hypothetical protein D9615_005474 [Tricholomella constricta]|uniref:Uncharacterized protein n=1 Tax=Tricholomella constricta TaxID=117010 RepID=A0A8H5M5Q6_9AGAR|nr:hypothetical protein D9615_005474 [Tricholomella constricta]